MVALSENAVVVNSSVPTVLVIDDERGPRESLRILLKPDCHVLCAGSVDEGISLLKAHHPDTIVMDIRMPDKSGIEGLRAIREFDRVVSVIMFTGFGALETAQEALRLGANDYVKKPFDAFEIRGLIHKHIQRTRQERRRREAEVELQSMNQTLKAELDRRTRLAALGQKSAELVHDLRNPLSVILGYVELLASKVSEQEGSAFGVDSYETATYLENIEKSVHRCRDLTDMWLNVSRGKLRCVSFDIVALLRSIVHDNLSHASSLHARLTVEAQPAQLMIEADQVQLGRAIQNMITNALQAGAGSVRVWCSRNGDTLEIGVEDNGCGMTPEQVAHATEPFVTAKAESGGTGLGMFIVLQIVEAHGGKVNIESTPGTGSKITLAIPLRPG